MENKIIMFQTIAGEMIVGKAKSITDKSIKLFRPARILVVDSANGKTNVAIVPIVISTFADTDEYEFPFAALSVYPVPASDTVANQWNRQFGSNLILPQNPKIIT